MSADVQHHHHQFGPPHMSNPNAFNNAAKLAMLQQSVLRSRGVPAGPIFTNTGLTPEELLAAKKPFTRKSVDYNASMINMIEVIDFSINKITSINIGTSHLAILFWTTYDTLS